MMLDKLVCHLGRWGNGEGEYEVPKECDVAKLIQQRGGADESLLARQKGLDIDWEMLSI